MLLLSSAGTVELSLSNYQVESADQLATPALLLYLDVVEANIDAGIRLAGGDPNRWRPHVKTVKSLDVVRMLVAHGVNTFKCAITAELQMCCEAGASDVLFAMPAVGATVRRVALIARQFPATKVSALIESGLHLATLKGTGLGVFIDVNPGMNRTGIAPERVDEILHLARLAGEAFRGLHYYDGQIGSGSLAEREERAQSGYSQLLALVDQLSSRGQPVPEVVTSGTPVAPAAIAYQRFAAGDFVHRISPGTIVLNDMSSLAQLPGFGFAPAALVLTTVISHPAPGIVTCDAGHKSVSADAGVPTCTVLGHPELTPLKPSEEHLPMQVQDGATVPAIGEQLYLLPRHVCPTVNLFDFALGVSGGTVRSRPRISARGHLD